jgi:Icc-related predicted phosphoesterase
MVIHSGDCGNSRKSITSVKEVSNFLNWFSELPINYKVFVAGNHDTCIEAGLITKEEMKKRGIDYLCNESVFCGDYKVWGSPYTPTYNNWSFQKARHKMHNIWELIPDNIDILVTHGPPKGILDLTDRPDNTLEQCGCNALRKKVMKVKPLLMAFGHIHNCASGLNGGTRKLPAMRTIFSNGSVVKDNHFGILESNGNFIQI